MRTILYDKLIRDCIPEIISRAGKECTTEVLSEKEYIEKLKEKLIEEANEVYNASGEEIAEELADVMEIILAIEKAHGISHEDVIDIQKKKAMSNGKFDKRLLLKEVREDD